MMWLLRSLADPLFGQQGGAVVFFPFSVAWMGYEVSAELRERLKYLLAPYVAYGTCFLFLDLFSPSMMTLSQHGIRILGYPFAAAVFLLYVIDVSAVTRGLPRVAVDVGTSRSALVRFARWIPMLTWQVMCVGGVFMTAAAILALVSAAVMSRHDLLSAADGVAFFGLGAIFSIGQLRLARLVRRPAAC